MGKHESNHKAGLFVAFLVGVSLGILFAPKSGKESRAYIAKTTKQTSEKLDRKLRHLQAELSDYYVVIQKRATELKGKARSEAESYARFAAGSVDKANQTIKALRDGTSNDEDLASAVASAQDAIQYLRKFIAK